MKVLTAVRMVIGMAIGLGCLGLAAAYWFLISYGPFPSGVIKSGQVSVPFVWQGEMTGKDYVIVAALALVGVWLIVVSYRFGVRGRGKPGAPPNPEAR